MTGPDSRARRQGAGGLLPASLQASAVSIMWEESREWMKLGGKALPCLATSGVVLVPFMIRTFCSTVQIDWSSCAAQPACRDLCQPVPAGGGPALTLLGVRFEETACVRSMA